MTAADKLAELLALAEKATPGPWSVSPDPEQRHVVPMYSVFASDDDLGSVADCYNYTQEQDKANATYIAAASPAVVAALVQVAQEARIACGVAENMYVVPMDDALDALDAALTAGQAENNLAAGMGEKP